jgi:hypothetical protein
LLTVLAPHAHADPALSGLQRCQAGASADYVADVAFAGGSAGESFPGGADPFNAVLPNDAVRVTVTGTISYDIWGDRVGPNGNDITAPSNYPFPGFTELSSIARWNNRPGGWVGSPMQTTSLNRCTAAPSVPTRLLFYMNDPARWDNGGQWNIHVEVFKSSGAVGPTAMQRCLTGTAATYTQDVAFGGGSAGGNFPDGVNPYNAILPGDVVRVTVTGTISYDIWGDRVGPNGNDVTAPSGFPFPGLTELSSVAVWNNNPGGWIGSAFQTTNLNRCTAAPGLPARLMFFVNDPTRWDNGGQWTIHVEVFRS